MGKGAFVAAVCLFLLSSAMVSLTGAACVPRSDVPTPIIQATAVNFPDPLIIQVDNIWYGFGTSVFHANVQVAVSANFIDWNVMHDDFQKPVDALPKLGDWVVTDKYGNPNVWAPGVIERDDGKFVLYYSALATESIHCVGYAISDTITGPYVDVSNKPLFCPKETGGAIDASGFKDTDGKRYIVYKVDGNAIGHGGSCGNGDAPQVVTPIILQPVEPDGITFAGPATTILHRTESDGPLVEAPSLIRVPTGQHMLFYSSGCFASPSYDTRYAVSNSGVLGPYERVDEPLMRSGELVAPGSGSAVWVEGEVEKEGRVERLRKGAVYFAFHAGPPDFRQMYVRKLKLKLFGQDDDEEGGEVAVF